MTQVTELTPEQAAMQAEAQAASEQAAAEQVAQVQGEQADPDAVTIDPVDKKVKRGTPTYALEPVGEQGLPVQKRGTLNIRDRKTIYVPLLGEVAGQPGQWFGIATYTSLTGARSAAKALAEDIARPATDPEAIPVQGGVFEFETRRRVKSDNDSVLYARFMTPELTAAEQNATS